MFDCYFLRTLPYLPGTSVLDWGRRLMNQTNTWIFLKIFIFITCVIVALCIYVILPPFKALEQSELTRNLDRCQATLLSEAESLSVLNKDWAEWSDTYTFVQNANKKYIEDNLDWDYLHHDLGLNTLYIITLEGQIIWGESSQNPSTKFPLQVLDLILPQGSIFQNIIAGSFVSGLIPSAEGYWLISANKITQNSGEAPMNGIMVMGKFLSPDFFSKLSNQLQLDFNLSRPPIDEGIAVIKNDHAGSTWKPLSSDKAQAFRQIDDLVQSTSTWIAITVPRDIYNQGLNSALLSGIVLIIMAIGFSFLWAKSTDKTNKLKINTLQLIEQEKDLRESEQKFRIAFATSPDAIILSRFVGGIYDINEGFTRVTGYKADEVIGKTSLEVNIWKNHEDREELIKLLSDKGFAENFEAEFVTKEGAVINGLLSARTVEIAGEKLILSITRDITARKKAEQERLNLETQLRHKYKMDSVGVMAGGMAHNFNNNLSIILGNIELANMKMPLNPEIDSYLRNAKTTVLRSRDLIQQILTYSRQGVKGKTSIQLSFVIEETLQLLRSTMPTTMNLQQRVSSDSHDLVINANSSQIQECLINLCNNAMYAMEEEGDLIIALDRVELQKHDIPIQYESLPGPYAKLSVQDTGSGMSAETVDKVFDLFFTTKSVDEGTGVGLSTVQGIVTQLGGFIKVNSRLGEGTTFELYLPLTEQAQTTEASSVSEDLPGGTEHILFVDDNPMLASLGEQMLKTKGYTVTIMTDSIETMELFSANPDRYDLVITDQTMPDLTGKELIQKVKTIRADIPTIIFTGFSSKIDKEKAAELGINAFLMKPLDMPLLLQTVRRVLDGK